MNAVGSRGVERVRRVVGAAAAALLVIGVVAALGRPSTVAARAGAQEAVPPTATTAPTTAPAPTTTAVPPTTTTTTTVAPPPRRWRVGVANLTFVDRSRPTPPVAGDAGAPSRTLPTVVLYPAAGSASDPPLAGAPAGPGGPFPLIVFAHGFNSSPAVYASLLDAWAGAGYVVAAPEFPRSVAGARVDESDLDHQPADISFVISSLLGGALPAGLVDAGRIGVAGQSDGAVTAVGVGYNTCCHDPRVKADVVMAGDAHDFAGGSYFAKGAPPLLVLQGDQDGSNNPALAQQLYDAAPSPKVLIMLVGAQHLPPFTTDGPHLAIVEAATLGFFDHYLKGSSDGLANVIAAARSPLATLLSG